METDKQLEVDPVFPQTVTGAISNLKTRLQHEYERAYPALAEIIHIVLDEEETKAWELSSFPHLLLPDLVEAHIAQLGLQRAETSRDNVLVPHDFTNIDNYQPAVALCG
jgi:hypothetical protein